MIQVTVVAGQKITVSNGHGGVRTYVGGEQPFIPAADAKKFIAAGICVAV